MKYVKEINEMPNIFGDDIASVEQWDFSRANLNDEARIEGITKVASVCYANPNVVGKESLYNRLKAESIGLPSSSFEFIPMLVPQRVIDSSFAYTQTNMWKYGEVIEEDGQAYLLTNYRAAVYDAENGATDFTGYYNTESECKIIAKHFKVFLSKLDMVTRTQYIRHRVNWQELSRRYVSGKKVDFEFYISEGMKDVRSIWHHSNWMEGGKPFITNNTKELIEMCVRHYFSALEQKVHPQEARRILPQACYTTVWSAWQPKQLKNFLDLRDDGHAQWEIRQLAQAKKKMLKV
jgi:thymidylate synthase (FAD)